MKKTPMQDLKEDLIETKTTAKEAIDEVKDEFKRTELNKYVQKTLDAIIHRIDTELIPMETEQIFKIKFLYFGLGLIFSTVIMVVVNLFL
jgi:hypothetical protein